MSGLEPGDLPDDRDSTRAGLSGASGLPAGEPGPPPVDLGRRSFFRSFSREAIQAAAQLVGAAAALQRSTLAATGQLLGADSGDAPAADPLARFLGLEDPVPPPAPVQFRSPYRYRDGELTLIDQRRLPDELVEVTCHTGPEVAACIRDRLVRGGPVLGQVAAYGLLVAAERSRGASEFIRAATLHGTINALRSSRPSSRSIETAMDRMLAAWQAVGEHAAGDLVANVLRAEAEAIAEGSMLGLAALGRWGASVLPAPADRRLEVLVHGPVGAFAGGTLGTALAVVLELKVRGQELHVWVPEGRPSLQGARITAFELGRLEVPHTVIADAAAAGIIARGSVDAVLAGAERIARNGDVSAAVGTYPLAAVAARHSVPVYVCAPLSSLDPRVGDGWGFMSEDGPAEELAEVNGRRVPPAESLAYSPLLDVTPAALLRGFITEIGVLGPPFEETLVASDAASAVLAPGNAAPSSPTPSNPTPGDRAAAIPDEDGAAPSAGPGVVAEDEDGWGEADPAEPGPGLAPVSAAAAASDRAPSSAPPADSEARPPW